jgi:hypothetical protein
VLGNAFEIRSVYVSPNIAFAEKVFNPYTLLVGLDAVVLIQAKDLDKHLGQAGRRGLEVDDTLQQLSR